MVVNSPLEQFEQHFYSPWLFEIYPGYGPFAFSLIFSCGLFFVVTQVLGSGRLYLIPSPIQHVVEQIYLAVIQIVKTQVGSQGLVYFPYIFSLFSFILCCNLLGLIPFSFTPTAQIFLPFYLAFISNVGLLIIGFYFHGLAFLKLFAPSGISLALLPLISVIEVSTYLLRTFSLALRLFANMMAGHTLLFICSLLLYFAFSYNSLPLFAVGYSLVMAIFSLEMLITFLQAYVFCVLFCVYLNDALHPGHLFVSFILLQVGCTFLINFYFYNIKMLTTFSILCTTSNTLVSLFHTYFATTVSGRIFISFFNVFLAALLGHLAKIFSIRGVSTVLCFMLIRVGFGLAFPTLGSEVLDFLSAFFTYGFWLIRLSFLVFIELLFYQPTVILGLFRSVIFGFYEPMMGWETLENVKRVLEKVNALDPDVDIEKIYEEIEKEQLRLKTLTEPLTEEDLVKVSRAEAINNSLYLMIVGGVLVSTGVVLVPVVFAQSVLGSAAFMAVSNPEVGYMFTRVAASLLAGELTSFFWHAGESLFIRGNDIRVFDNYVKESLAKMDPVDYKEQIGLDKPINERPRTLPDEIPQVEFRADPAFQPISLDVTKAAKIGAVIGAFFLITWHIIWR